MSGMTLSTLICYLTLRIRGRGCLSHLDFSKLNSCANVARTHARTHTRTHIHAFTHRATGRCSDASIERSVDRSINRPSERATSPQTGLQTKHGEIGRSNERTNEGNSRGVKTADQKLAIPIKLN